jgi:hypothetical protein
MVDDSYDTTHQHRPEETLSLLPSIKATVAMLGTAKNHGDENAWCMDVIQPPLRLARAESVSSAWYSAECVRGYNSE